jgi:hypothetical protein
METSPYCEFLYPRILNHIVYRKNPIKLLEGDQYQFDEFNEEVFQNLYHITTILTKEESIKVEESVYDYA